MSERVEKIAQLVLSVLGLLGCLIAAEILIYRYNLRVDLTPESLYTLSGHTKRILRDLEQEVEIVAFTRSADPRADHLRDLFRRVTAVTPKVSYRILDVNRNPGIARQYGAESYGAIFVESGGKRQSFMNMEEELLAAAILSVTRDREKVVYTLTGHGEADFESSDHRRGYSRARRALEYDFYEVRPLFLKRGDPIPDDAAVVVVASPDRSLPEHVISALGEYLGRGGGLLVLAEPGASPTLVDFVRRYRILLADEAVADPELSMAASEPLTFRVSNLSANHMVTKALELEPVFSFARPIYEAPPGESAAEVVLQPLLKTSDTSWRIPLRDGELLGDPGFDAARDRRGQATVGAEVVIRIDDTASPEDLPAGEALPRPVSRLIVYGDADFANDFFIQYLGNRDLFVNSVNWLAREEGLINVRPDQKVRGTEQFFVTRRQSYWAFVLATIVEPAVFFALGVVVFAWRRMR